MTTTGTGTPARVVIVGTVNGYDVTVMGDGIVIERDAEHVARERVDGLARFVSAARSLALGGGQFPDGAGVISVSGRDDACSGSTVTLNWPDGSEGGSCWYPGTDESA